MASGETEEKARDEKVEVTIIAMGDEKVIDAEFQDSDVKAEPVVEFNGPATESFSIHFYINRDGIPSVSTDKTPHSKTHGIALPEQAAHLLRGMHQLCMTLDVLGIRGKDALRIIETLSVSYDEYKADVSEGD